MIHEYTAEEIIEILLALSLRAKKLSENADSIHVDQLALANKLQAVRAQIDATAAILRYMGV